MKIKCINCNKRFMDFSSPYWADCPKCHTQLKLNWKIKEVKNGGKKN